MGGHLLLAAAATTEPSWFWYATRGLGVSSLVLLTGSLALGIQTAERWSGRATPGFVVANLHRNLSLLAVLLVVAHIVTTVLDPFAHITVRDVLVPVGAAYRPVWLGLGVVAFEVLAGVAATSLLRGRLGPGLWKLIHWTAYASWPLAVVHGLGTGSDSQAPWLIAVVAASVMAVVLVLGQRLLSGRLSTLPVRLAALLVTLLALYLGSSWAFQGPFQQGWSARAGTPPVATARGPVHPGPDGFSDPLGGVIVRDAGGYTQIALRDLVDTGLTVAIRSPGSTESLPVLTIARDGHQLCSVPASVGSTLYALCGTTRLTIAIYGGTPAPPTGQSGITGRLVTSAPLN